MSVVLRSDFEAAKAQLEDTLESLGAALARIEVFRQREKLLLAEVAKLRNEAAAAGGGCTQPADSANASAAAQAPEQSQEQQQLPQTQPQQQQPTYITECEGQLPVMLLAADGRRTPGSIVITPQHVDFVTVQARIKRADFIGITATTPVTAAPGSGGGKRSSGGGGGSSSSYYSSTSLRLKNFLPSCISAASSAQQQQSLVQESPLPQQQQFRPPGMAHLVQQPLPAWTPGAAAAADNSSSSPASTSTAGDVTLAHEQQQAFGAPASPLSQQQQQGGEPSGWASPQALRHCSTWHASTAAGETQVTQAGAAAGGGPGSPHSNSRGGSSGSDGGSAAAEARGVWKMLWRGGGMQQQLTFEATQTTREVLHRHTLRWLGGQGSADAPADTLSQLAAAAAGGGDGGALAGAAGSEGGSGGGVDLTAARHLAPGSFTPRLSEPSAILLLPGSSTAFAAAGSGHGSSSSSSPVFAGFSAAAAAAAGVPGEDGGGLSPRSAASANAAQLVVGAAHIAAALPVRFRARDWTLLYSTARHGISLQTLYRRAAGQSASVLLVRDAGGYVFGAFCCEPWRPAARFFGTGESFVFQLAPHKAMWPWKAQSALKNDFFQYGQPDALGVGGLGAFAIWLDGELLNGSSGACGTFGSPCLASREEFRVAALELWGLQK